MKVITATMEAHQIVVASMTPAGVSSSHVPGLSSIMVEKNKKTSLGSGLTLFDDNCFEGQCIDSNLGMCLGKKSSRGIFCLDPELAEGKLEKGTRYIVMSYPGWVKYVYIYMLYYIISYYTYIILNTYLMF